MKRFVKCAGMFMLCVMLAASSITVFAADTPQKEIKVFLDGTQMSFDVNPIIESDRTMVPFRAIFEALGCTVDYSKDADGQHVTAVKEDKRIELKINSPEMKVNDAVISIEPCARIIKDRTLVPLRAVSEALDCTVDWDGATRTVTITSPGNNGEASGHQAIVSHWGNFEASRFMQEGEYDVKLYPETITENADGTQTMKVQFYAYDIYDVDDIAKMSVGDTIQYCRKVITVDSIEKLRDGYILINGGLESGKDNAIDIELTEGGVSWRSTTPAGGYPNYFSVGEPQVLKVSKELKLTDAYGGEPGKTDNKADYSNYRTYMQSNSPDSWSVGNTRILLITYEIAEINRIWVP